MWNIFISVPKWIIWLNFLYMPIYIHTDMSQKKTQMLYQW